MWFKGLSLLSYTALLVTTTNATGRGRGGIVHNGRNQLSARRHNIPYLHGRQQAWKNETRPSVTSQEPESTVSEPVVIVTSDLQATTTETPVVRLSSTVLAEEPVSSTAPLSEAPLPTSSTPIVESPVPSSDITPPKPSSSVAEELVQEPALLTSVAPSSSSQAEPSTTSIRTSSVPLPTSEPIVDPVAESRPSTAAALPTSSTLIPDPSSVPLSSSVPVPIDEPSLPVPGPTSVLLLSSSISAPVDELSSSFQLSSSAVQPSSVDATSAPEPTTIPTVIQEPAPISTSEPLSVPTTIAPVVVASSTLIEPVFEPTSTTSPAVDSVSIPELSITQVPSSSTLPQPSDIIATDDSENQAPVVSTSSASALAIPSPSPTSEGPAVPTSTGDVLPASQTGIDVPGTTAPTTVLASSNNIQPTSSISEAQATPSNTGEGLFPVVSGGSTASVIEPTITTPESSSILGSTSIQLLPSSETAIPIPTGIPSSVSVPTLITSNGGIPASESLTLPSDISTLSDLVPNQTGLPTPSVTGTGQLPESSLVSSLEPSQVSQADSTALIEDSNTKGALTTSAPAVLLPLPSFELINTAVSSTANQTDVPTQTGIPASETLSTSTLAATDLPLNSLPAPGSTTGISGPTNATNVPSGFVGSATSGQLPIITDTAQPFPTRIMKEDTQAPIVPIPTSESITSTSATSTGATQSDSPSATSGSVGLSDDPNQPSETLASGEAPIPTGLPAVNVNFVPSSTVSPGVGEINTAHPSSTTTAAAAPPPAPLSKSQTAGIAIGGTTCLLVALVAGLFVARRYHTNAAGKRESKGVYPEVAYLYDPPAGNHDAESGGGVHAMSGGASGLTAAAHNAPGQGPHGAFPPPVHSRSPRHSMASAWAANSNEPSSGNPFSDPQPLPNHALHAQNISRHIGTDSTVSAWPTGNQAHASTPFLSPIMMPKSLYGNFVNHGRTDTTVSAWPAGNQNRSSQDLVTSPVIIPRSTFQSMPKHEPKESTVSTWPQNRMTMPDSDNPFVDPVGPIPQSSAHVGAHGGSVNKEMEEYVALAVNPYAFNPHAPQYPPMSPYVQAFGDPTASRDSGRYSDPFSDPFEHDLLLNVDVRSETQDSIHLVTASPPTPRSPNSQARYTPEPNAVSNNNLQPIARVPVGGRYSPHQRSSTSDSLAPPRGFTPDGRYTPELSSGVSTLNNSPVIGPLQTATAVPLHKGWDEFKTNDQLAMPPPLNLAQPMKTKPSPLHRQPTLAGAGQILLQGPGLPLIVKRKEVGTGYHGQNDSTGSGFGLEVPSMYGSPGPTINDFGGDLDSQRKRSGELMFADPQLVGRQF